MNVTLEQVEKMVTEHGSGFSIYVNPEDLWNSAHVYVTRQWGDDAAELDKKWRINISHSSSSTGPKNVDAILTAGLMVAQINEAIEITRFLLNNLGNLEAAWQAKRAAELAEVEARAAERQAKIDADKQLSDRDIDHLIATMCVDIKHGGKHKVRKQLRRRGYDGFLVRLTARATMGGAVQFKLNDVLYSKAKLAEALKQFAEVRDPEVKDITDLA